MARDDGKPHVRPAPKAELRLLALPGRKTAMAVTGSVLVVVVATLLILLALRM